MLNNSIQTTHANTIATLHVFSDVYSDSFCVAGAHRGGRVKQLEAMLRDLSDTDLPLYSVPNELTTQFTEAVAKSEARVWILDPYFGRPVSSQRWCGGVVATVEGLKFNRNQVEVHFLSCAEPCQGHRELVWASLNLHHSGPDRRLEWKKLGRDVDVHDRFAVIDDELWHFGATVGGLHPSVNAASRGWSAIESGFERFFDHLWRDAIGIQPFIDEHRMKVLRDSYKRIR